MTEAAERPPGRWRLWLKRAALVGLCLFGVLPLAVIVAYRFVDPPVTPLMLLREGEGLGRDWQWRALDDFPVEVIQAAIAAEDWRFCDHWGVDVSALQGAYARYQKGGRLTGASTISMQVTRNILLWPNRSFIRKGLELMYAPLVDAIWGKDRVMEIYLNIAEWGPGIYGANAAARAWFGHDIEHLYPDEIARLFTILPSPLHWNPRSTAAPVRQRFTRVNRAMKHISLGRGWAVCPD